MTHTLSITKAREELPALVENAKKKRSQYLITVNGIPAAVLMSADEYESWQETNDILSDPKLVKAIKRGEKELEEGKGIPWEKVKKELDLE